MQKHFGQTDHQTAQRFERFDAGKWYLFFRSKLTQSCGQRAQLKLNTP